MIKHCPNCNCPVKFTDTLSFIGSESSARFRGRYWPRSWALTCPECQRLLYGHLFAYPSTIRIVVETLTLFIGVTVWVMTLFVLSMSFAKWLQVSEVLGLIALFVCAIGSFILFFLLASYGIYRGLELKSPPDIFLFVKDDYLYLQKNGLPINPISSETQPNKEMIRLDDISSVDIKLSADVLGILEITLHSGNKYELPFIPWLMPCIHDSLLLQLPKAVKVTHVAARL